MPNNNPKTTLKGWISVPIGNREYDKNLLKQYNGTVWGTFKVNYNDFDLNGVKGQVRKGDLDPAHLDRMKVSVAKKGITHWPVGTYNPLTGKITLISGHHRIEALIQTSYDNRAIFPVMIVDFPSKLHERQWMRKENKHLTSLAKPSSNADAVIFVQEMKNDFGLFKNLTEEQSRKKVYSMLDDFYPFIKGPAKKGVYDKAFSGEIEVTIQTMNKAFQSNVQVRIWGQIYGAGKTIGDSCYIASLYDPSRKSIMMQCTERGLAHDTKPDTSVMEINLITWFPTKIGNLALAREQALDVYRRMNSHVIDGKLAFIKEVVFPEQDTSKDTTSVHTYTWDSNTKQFV